MRERHALRAQLAALVAAAAPLDDRPARDDLAQLAHRLRVQVDRLVVRVIAEQSQPVDHSVATLARHAHQQPIEFFGGDRVVAVEPPVRIAQPRIRLDRAARQPCEVSGLEAGVPVLRRREQVRDAAVARHELREEARVPGLREEPAELRVDQAVEDPVLRGRHARIQPRVAEQHVIELVQHQHREMLVGAAVLRDEGGVDQHPRALAGGHARGGHRVAATHLEQREQRRERLAGHRHAGPDAVAQAIVLVTHGGLARSSRRRPPRAPPRRAAPKGSARPMAGASARRARPRCPRAGGAPPRARSCEAPARSC